MQCFKTLTAVGLSLAASLTLLPSYAQEQGNVAVVNGVPIPQARMDMILKSQVQQGQQDTPEMRKNLKDVLITREIIAQDAIKKGLDKQPDVQTQLDLAKQEFLIRAYFDDLLTNSKPTDDQLRAEYEKIKASQTEGGSKMEYRPRHILVKTEKEAKAVLANLKKTGGKNFAQIAKQKSMDSGSKAEGGLLDWSDGSTYVPEFTQGLTKLQKGEYTKEPVKSQFGYHIIMLEDTRNAQFPPFDQVKDKVQQEVLKQLRDKKIDELRAAAKIE
jgi:peptidyl-prolyl cis-trans isomerase C